MFVTIKIEIFQTSIVHILSHPGINSSFLYFIVMSYYLIYKTYIYVHI